MYSQEGDEYFTKFYFLYFFYMYINCRKIRFLERNIDELKAQASNLLSKKTTHVHIQDIERKMKEFSGKFILYLKCRFA